jgi:exosortase A
MSASVGAASVVRRDYAALLGIVGIAVFVGILYMGSFAGIGRLWANSEYRYGALVVPVAALLLWRAREALGAVELKPWAPGLIVVAGLVIVWLLSAGIGVQVTEQLAAVLLIPAVVATVLGVALIRLALFPLLFLVAVVPMGDGLLPYLMRFTAIFSAELLRLAGLPVFRDGQFIALPAGNFLVADVCAGLNYLTAGTLVALLFAYLTFQSYVKRVVFVLASALILVLANGLRAFIIMYVASATDMKYLTGRDHVWFGWVLFGVIVVAGFWLAGRWADVGNASDAHEPARLSQQAKAPPWSLALVLVLVLLAATAQRFQAAIGSSWQFLLPVGVALLWLLYRQVGRGAPAPRADGRAEASSYGNTRALAVVCAAAVALAFGPIASRSAGFASHDAEGQGSALVMPDIEGCERAGAWDGPWRPSLEQPDFVGTANFSCTGVAVNAFVAGYRTGGQGKEVVNETYHLVPEGWLGAETGRGAFEARSGEIVEVNELQLLGSIDAVVWYWYDVHGRTAMTPFAVKLQQAYGLVTLRGAGSRVYIVETPLGSALTAARERLANASRALWTGK